MFIFLKIPKFHWYLFVLVEWISLTLSSNYNKILKKIFRLTWSMLSLSNVLVCASCSVASVSVSFVVWWFLNTSAQHLYVFSSSFFIMIDVLVCKHFACSFPKNVPHSDLDFLFLIDFLVKQVKCPGYDVCPR